MPSGNVETRSVAVPELSGTVPNAVLPSKKVTVPPLGVAVSGGATAIAAVRVTDWPTATVAAETCKDVKRGAGATVSVPAT